MWCGFFGPTASFVDAHARPDWPDGFHGRTLGLRPYIMYFGRGYPNVIHGPIRASGWYALWRHEWEAYPFGPFPSRVAAGAWWQRWLATPCSRLRTWAWRTTPGAVPSRRDCPVPRDARGFRRLAPAHGIAPPRAGQPRRANFPRSTPPFHVPSDWWQGMEDEDEDRDGDAGEDGEEAEEPSLSEAGLIELLRHYLDSDVCGTDPKCGKDRCVCHRLGRGGRRVDIYGDDEEGWGFRYPWPSRECSPTYATLGEAVRACRAQLPGPSGAGDADR